MKQGEQMVFTNDLGEEEVFYVQAATVLGGVHYILVTETEDLAGDAYIMKQSEETEMLWPMFLRN